MSDVSTAPTVSCADCLSRRDFVARSAGLAAAAAFFAACGDSDGITSPNSPTGPTGGKQIKVSDFPGLANLNQLVLVDNQRAVKRTGTTTFVAFSRACTHEGTAVAVVGSGASFECPNHGARFDNNGRVTFGPAQRNLSTLTTHYDSATDLLTIG